MRKQNSNDYGLDVYDGFFEERMGLPANIKRSLIISLILFFIPIVGLFLFGRDNFPIEPAYFFCTGIFSLIAVLSISITIAQLLTTRQKIYKALKFEIVFLLVLGIGAMVYIAFKFLFISFFGWLLSGL